MNVGSLLSSFTEVQMVMRKRAAALGVTRIELDQIAKLTPGYSGKLLTDPPTKHLGAITLPKMLKGLGLKMVLVEDPEATLQSTLARTATADRQASIRAGDIPGLHGRMGD